MTTKAGVTTLIAVGVIAVLAVVIFRPGATDAADVVEAFFTALHEGDFDAAYDRYLSAEFQKSTSLEQLKDHIVGNSMDTYRRTEWRGQTLTPGLSIVEGLVERDDGVHMLVRASLIGEDGHWQIIRIDRIAPGMPSFGQKSTVPDDDALTELVDSSMSCFARVIKTRDCSDFYSRAASVWQVQTTPEAVCGAFMALMEHGFDFSVIEGVTPVFSQPPHLDPDGGLPLSGYYPTPGQLISFNLVYLYEHPQWKLLSLNVNVRSLQEHDDY